MSLDTLFLRYRIPPSTTCVLFGSGIYLELEKNLDFLALQLHSMLVYATAFLSLCPLDIYKIGTQTPLFNKNFLLLSNFLEVFLGYLVVLGDFMDRFSNVLHVTGGETRNRYSAVPGTVDGVLHSHTVSILASAVVE